MKHHILEQKDINDIPVNLDDYRILAKKELPYQVFDYIDGGACDEITIANNRIAFNDIHLRPLSLRDVGEVDLSTKMFGKTFNSPVFFSPTGLHQLVDKYGEVSTAKAAKELNIPMIVSSMSSIPLEDIAADSGNENLWFQTYIFKDRESTRDLIHRAEKAGYKTLVVTTGCPIMGKRDKNIKNRFSLPKNITAGNFKIKNSTVNSNNPIYTFDGAELDPSASWQDIEWIRSITRLPLILKGIMNPVDVKHALDHQVDAIVISNHGGRQLDTTEATIKVLPEIAAAASGRIPLLIDSGFRRGTDVLKAIALGADAVLLGRPVLWALAVNGEKGIINAFRLLVEELKIAMQLCGCSDQNEIRENSAVIIS